METSEGWMKELDTLFERTEAASRGSFGVIPDKTRVKVRVTSQKFDYSINKGTPGVKVVLEVAEGEYESKKIWHDFWLTEKNLPYLKRDLATLGYAGKLTILAQESCVELIGLGAEITVTVEEYEAQNKETGELEKRSKNKVAFWNSHWSPPQEDQPVDDGSDMEVPF